MPAVNQPTSQREGGNGGLWSLNPICHFQQTGKNTWPVSARQAVWEGAGDAILMTALTCRQGGSRVAGYICRTPPLLPTSTPNHVHKRRKLAVPPGSLSDQHTSKKPKLSPKTKKSNKDGRAREREERRSFSLSPALILALRFSGPNFPILP